MSSKKIEENVEELNKILQVMHNKGGIGTFAGKESDSLKINAYLNFISAKISKENLDTLKWQGWVNIVLTILNLALLGINFFLLSR